MNIIRINQVDEHGNVVDKIDCSVLKVLKETPGNIMFVGLNGFFDIDVVRAEKHYEDDGSIGYYVRHNWALNLPNIIDIDSDYDS